MTSWEESFVAVSVVLEGSADDALDFLDETTLLGASPVIVGLRSESKSARAYALATALAAIARELDDMEIRVEIR